MTSTRPRESVSSSNHMNAMFGRDMLFAVVLSLPLVSALFITPVMTRVLGPDSFGRYATDLAMQQIAFSVAALGLHIGVQRVFSTEDGPVKARVVLTWAVGVAVLLTGVLLATGSFWTAGLGLHHFTADARLTVVWSGLIGITWVALAIVRCEDRLALYAVGSLLQSVGTLAVGILVALLLGPTVAHVIEGCIVAQVVALALVVVRVRLGRPRPSQAGFVFGVLCFAVALMPQQIAMFVINSSDRFVVQRDLGFVVTGHYQVAYNVGAVGLLMSTYIVQTWLSRMFVTSDEDQRQETLRHARRALESVLLLAVLAFALAGPVLLRIWVPPSYHPGRLTLVLLLILVGTVPYARAMLSTNDLLASGRPAVVAAVFCGAAAVNLALNVVLVPRLQINGSALATLASFVCLGLLTGAATRTGWRRAGYRAWDLRRASLVGAVVAGALGSWYLPHQGWWQALRVVAATGFAVLACRALLGARTALGGVSPLVGLNDDYQVEVP